MRHGESPDNQPLKRLESPAPTSKWSPVATGKVRCIRYIRQMRIRVTHLSSRCKCRSTVRRSSDARCRSCRRSNRPAPGPCTWLRNPTPCLPWVSGGFELLLGRQQSRRPGVVLRGRAAPANGGGGSIRGLRFSPPLASRDGEEEGEGRVKVFSQSCSRATFRD